MSPAGSTMDGVTSWPRMRASRTRYEEPGVLVLDKPAGWSVMGERHDVDVVALARDAGEPLWPAHRIDKVTSGLVLLATDLDAHGALTRQFARHTIDKTYLALTATTGLPEHGTVELPLSVGRKNRVRVAAPREAITRSGGTWRVPDDAVFGEVAVYPSTTSFSRLWADDTHTLLAVRPTTGRRHQIRVHLAWIGHPLVGDPLFAKAPGTRTGLHAWRLGFDAPSSRVTVDAAPDAEFLALADVDPAVLGDA